ncbi:cyclohexanone monooxygenase [Capronia epimyces CBS 606.96]|uniref:Cyclohexanone monooxygenase n=1 Tax=Capronia epimyces CBS 606.96 TaxID=1182542 RepID=W9XCE9_9EURO|nr:cyclohexanone monooxygenase [Capronia epimyces CBS 606.96]EXJ78167.1 cyclohexanone monooxygenase [Capronia epimyces CBS 606.96]
MVRELQRDLDRAEGPIYAERHVRIICVGAGASGLCLAYKLQRSFQNFSLVIYEKNKEISGTWYENRYPGCACDVPSHNYTWSFEPKHNWSAVYAQSSEIYQYFNDFADKYSLRKYVHCNQAVIGARWDESNGGYHVQVKNGNTGELEEAFCDILINAGGILNAWRWPDIPGLKEFKGPLLHSADWDDTVDLKGKHVGLIGNGSSGIQILPAILPSVSHITTFVRSPAWISPVRGLDQHVFSAEEVASFANEPEKLLEYRKANEDGINSLWPLYVRGTDMQKAARKAMLKQMQLKLQGSGLEDKLIPSWSVGCRRLTPGINYLESLSHEKVTVVNGDITCITDKGPRDSDGNDHTIDVLVCATGFDTSFRPRFPIIGSSGTNLQDEWAQEAKGYMGIAAPNFPNYFLFLGPNCPIGNGPVLAAIEFQADYMLQFINRWQTENIHSFVPKVDATEDFIKYTDSVMQKTVWSEECRSWYKSNSSTGRVSALWPGSSLHYMEAIREARFDDYEIKYSGNRFAWMGNGSSQTELDATCDWSYYIRLKDDSPYASRRMQRQVLTKSGSTDGRSKTSFWKFE